MFRRAQREPDGLPTPSGVQGVGEPTWLPLAKWVPDEVRRPALGLLLTPIYLVAGNGTPGDPGCAQRGSGTQPVVCMAATERPPVGTRCFGLDEVRAGRTLTERFVQLSGSGAEVEGLEWLHTFSG